MRLIHILIVTAATGGGCALLGPPGSMPTTDDIDDLRAALSATKAAVVDTKAAQTELGRKVVGAIDSFESRAPDLKAAISTAEDIPQMVEGVGGIVSGLLPPPFGQLGLLATTLLGLARARHNRKAGRSVVNRIAAIADMNNGVIDLNKPETKMVLNTMGKAATRLVDEGKGKTTGIGI